MAKAVRICNIYEAYTLDGKPVAKGFADEVATALKCNPKSVGSYAENNNVVLKQWRIKKVGKAEKLVDNNINYEPKTKETFVERYWCLDYYGTTEMSEKEYARHKELIEDKGYCVKYTKIKIGKRRYAYHLEVV